MQKPPELTIIARMHSDFPTKFGIPRQSGMVDALKSFIVFEPQFRNRQALRGLEEFSHLWLIWGFSEVKRGQWYATVRPPRLGGNSRKGVFATRSPYRPNPLGLSCVKLDAIVMHPQLGPVLHVCGADLMDNTPIYDIKPYLAFTDSHPDAIGGFADKCRDHVLDVDFPEHLINLIPQERRAALLGVLSLDPRPAYHNDPKRIYGLSFAGFDIKFRVDGHLLSVCEVINIE